MSQRVSCSRPGCLLPGRACYDADDVGGEWLCREHAYDAGYCTVCGVWAADCMGYDLAPHLCEDCLDALEEDDPGW